eukprot:CAMPEP_0177267600 /NCGR_PEP_ID=MMETSP0367-20130122/63347_1 /TAXON_ID=447022 ORGANISM="Scrippsiella hangoei-like, Strain SHHI-4" /NCGR_SAMPLE_ID=MMETSP0367 /ASSEMBLY_ACC=CAM_ASM_000362 /LENGTH=63 /DNA_ID=CAMNT_0018723133 /DNA_START=30 /DNA_END=221 /DNA_ORIENTATION=+
MMSCTPFKVAHANKQIRIKIGKNPCLKWFSMPSFTLLLLQARFISSLVMPAQIAGGAWYGKLR